ncbi:hypothetical protein EOD40_09015 [Flavobacterium sufflavum]|uniref:ABM domain-containing protein n=1 Tax=Flavobacterium sufflavum TaxID=1921138 RepID=A0A3S2UJQ5_9FLAO|nr:hypothetical protein [Flavobacterium sufflavum]RVT76632.1 hypothetical protein EOD40_09015 [Flavobacterium sufflavum]
MISVIVTYQIKKEFIEQNKANIETFIKDFEKLDSSLFEYKVFTKQDGLTFVHHSLYKNEDIQKQLLNVPSFLEFQKQRDEIGLDGKAQIEILNLFASSDKKWKK